jgi:Fe-S cluster assembly iron-binding protein IscA
MNKIFRNLDDYEIIFPNIVGADVSDDIVFTKKAMLALMNELHDNYSFFDDSQNKMVYFVRLFVESSPTVAKKFAIKFDHKLEKFDRIFELRKIKIVIDRHSIFYFMGVLIDYTKNQNEEGFVFYETSEDFFSI